MLRCCCGGVPHHPIHPHPFPPLSPFFFRYARLCVLPVNTPAPASTLAKLWQGAGGSIGSIDSSSSEVEVKASLAALAALGVLSVAQLPDGRVWCLPQPQQLELLQVRGGGEGRG